MVEGRADPELLSPSALMVNLFTMKRMLAELGMPDTDNLEEGRSLIALAFANDPESLIIFQDKIIRNIEIIIKDSSDNKDDGESILDPDEEMMVYFEDGSLQSFPISKKKVFSSRLTPNENDIKLKLDQDL